MLREAGTSSRSCNRASPAAGPCTIATATAWLRVTIGFGATWSSTW